MKTRLDWYINDPAPNWWTFYVIPNISIRYQDWKHYYHYIIMFSWLRWSVFIEFETYKPRVNKPRPGDSDGQTFSPRI